MVPQGDLLPRFETCLGLSDFVGQFLSQKEENLEFLFNTSVHLGKRDSSNLQQVEAVTPCKIQRMSEMAS